MNPIPKTKIIRLKGQKLAKLNETIHQRDQHKCIYCGNRVDPGEKFHHEHNGIKKRPNRIRCTSVYGLPHRTTPRQKVQ